MNPGKGSYLQNIFQLEVEGDEDEALHELGVDELRFGGNDGQRFVTILSLKTGSPLDCRSGAPTFGQTTLSMMT